MKTLTADQIAQYHELGYLVVPEFVDAGAIRAAQKDIGSDHPIAADYFANPDEYPRYGKTQLTLRKFPFAAFSINRLVADEAMLAAARALLETEDIRLTKGEFWAKYAGAIDYDQGFHRDFGNHTLVVPRRDHRYKELTTFIYLHDVDETSGPTAVLPRTLTDVVPFGSSRLPESLTFDPGEEEALATGPAGTVLFYSYDVFHRGTNITGDEQARFMVLADYRRADAPWIARQGWPEYGGSREMNEFMTRVSPEARSLLDVPPPGHEYWNEQTVTDLGVRYPKMDVSPYRDALG